MRLRHIDIQNIWLKQEFKKGIFHLEYLLSTEMPADRLTKPLTCQKFEAFRSILNIVDITGLVKAITIDGSDWTQTIIDQLQLDIV